MAGALRLTGVQELAEALLGAAARVDAATPLALKAAADAVAKRTKANLELTSHARGTPTPSRPGQPPSKIDGALRDSIKTSTPAPVGAGTWVCSVYPDIVYGAIHEFGGMAGRGHSSRIPQRPYMRPSAEQAVSFGEVQRAFDEAWARALLS